ncbi:MAG: 3-dehydroquinate synthase [Anaerolineae bacterium]|nr:3-dehydroquinate synthase [Anaerolineae bacterium]MDW8067686.1 3-dehydroquinate synthase [Anaerolineae bacterium]
MPEPNIILTGFMGTGKTSVGREVADRLGWRFVDLDDLIVARAGKPIPQIFAEDGEPAFRALEAEICQELRAPASLVVATGGGTVVNPANREALAAGGILICLDARPEIILARLAGKDDRPLLAGPDREPRVAALLSQRAAAYAAIPHHIDTSDLSVAAVAERVLGIVAGLPGEGYRLMVRLHPDPILIGPPGPGDPHSAQAGRPPGYDILIADGLLHQAGLYIRRAGILPGRCAVVTNPTVGQFYAAPLQAALEAVGFEPLVFEVPDGEAYKALDTAADLYQRFADARLARGEPVIALGGGVIGDLAGFVAATWLRGVPLVQVPTSLLAMVDASVGGKVAVNLPQGKNLVGAFKQPGVVLIDPQVLHTLPEAEYRAAMAEVVKAALIGDPMLFERLTSGGVRSTAAMIADAVRVKARIVERDPYETGERAWLNLGHTFGHALELLSGFTLRHGEAVALGLVAAAELSAALGYCEPTLPARVRDLIGRLGLPVTCAYDPERAYAAMATDKKRRGRTLRFVLLRQIGQVELVEGVPESAVIAAWRTICQT